jgi:phosphate starvation-inducible PhoH-like protein
LQPLNQHQADLIEALYSKPMVITTGYAGTGKTYVATTLAAELLDLGAVNGGIDKIILTRPNVAAGDQIGFRPGTMQEKMREWFLEQLLIIEDVLSKAEVDIALKKRNIEMAPFETMRGRSFANAMVLLDEAQNTTYGQIKMAATRIGDGSTYAVNGDVHQSDLHGTSGLSHLINIINRHKMDIPIIEFGYEDIVRSELCRDMIVAFDSYEHEVTGGNQ